MVKWNCMRREKRKQKVWVFIHNELMWSMCIPNNAYVAVCQGWERSLVRMDTRDYGSSMCPAILPEMVEGNTTSHQICGIAFMVDDVTDFLSCDMHVRCMDVLIVLQGQLMKSMHKRPYKENTVVNAMTLIYRQDTLVPAVADPLLYIANATGAHGSNAVYLDRLVTTLDSFGMGLDSSSSEFRELTMALSSMCAV